MRVKNRHVHLAYLKRLKPQASMRVPTCLAYQVYLHVLNMRSIFHIIFCFKLSSLQTKTEEIG